MNHTFGSRTPDQASPLPSLPDPIPAFPEPLILSLESPTLPPPPFPQPWPRPPLHLWALRNGCYLINYKPYGVPLVTYDGTLRVERHTNGVTASGDLYQRPIKLVKIQVMPGVWKMMPVILPGPDPAQGIPIFARDQYVYYLRVTQILEGFTFTNGFTLGFEMWRFDKNSYIWSEGGKWTNEGLFTAQMTWVPAPSGYPSSGNYLIGDVKNSAGTVVGRLTMGWISEFLRKATIEIDRVAAAETPLTNGSGMDWQSAFRAVGWDIALDVSDTNVPEPSGESWSYAECHQRMLQYRDQSDLDSEWRYHILCIRKHDDPLACRGVMYDAYGDDSNNVPREGCVVCSHWIIPNENPWGTVKGQRYGTTVVYFRTAVHELAHAICLYHNRSDNGFMCTTDVIAENSPTTFPANIQWAFHPDDQKRLRHMPDIYVRPGGLPFGTSYSATPISPTDLFIKVEELELHVTPVLESVPLGAPVRVNLELVNNSAESMLAPASLNLKTGLVRGKVMDPSGTVRSFAPIVVYADPPQLQWLEPGQRVAYSLTLLRGPQGALFPASGIYHIVVEVRWEVGGVEAMVLGEAELGVTGAVDQTHAAAAHKILTTPDTLLTLVLGGDHLTNGIDAIQTALQSDMLRPHYAYVEAKRLAERFGKRKANIKDAADLIDESTVMSLSEMKKAATLITADGLDDARAERIARLLKHKTHDGRVADDSNALIKTI